MYSDKINRRILSKALFIRLFEYSIAHAGDLGYIKVPYYLCVGQELAPAAASEVLAEYCIFAQHRCHGYYLAYGGDPQPLVDELLGLASGTNKGRCGSASISSKDINMFGHSGFMGDNIPIGVGFAIGSNKKVLIVAGDAAAEEDYSLTAAGYAATKAVKIIFLCEDNGLSILTPIEVRRKWELSLVMESLGLNSYSIEGNMGDIIDNFKKLDKADGPGFVNIKVQRAIWHAGSGFDGIDQKDLLSHELRKYEDIKKNFDLETVLRLWKPFIGLKHLNEMTRLLNSILNDSDILKK